MQMAFRTKRARRRANTKKAIVKRGRVVNRIFSSPIPVDHRLSKFTLACDCSWCTQARACKKREERDFNKKLEKEIWEQNGFDGVSTHNNGSWKDYKKQETA